MSTIETEVIIMHNILSSNQLAEWNHFEELNDSDEVSLVNDYFDCLIDCDDDAASCKRICRRLFA